MIAQLIISMAFAAWHRPDSESLNRWMNGTYEDRIEVDRQWEYERKVLEMEERQRELEEDLEREERRERWERITGDDSLFSY